MKILVCGSNEYKDYEKVFGEILKANPKIVILGGAKTGADALAKKAATELGMIVKEYKANWGIYGKDTELKRNQLMLDDNPDLKTIIVFHEDIENSVGTKDMLKRATEKGIRVLLIN